MRSERVFRFCQLSIPLVASLIGVAGFTQIYAAEKDVSPITPNCHHLTSENSFVVNGSGSDLIFSCDARGAFIVLREGRYLPTFKLPSVYSSLSVTNGISNTLSNGVPILLAPGTYRYVAHYSGAPTSSPLSGFKIVWRSIKD